VMSIQFLAVRESFKVRFDYKWHDGGRAVRKVLLQNGWIHGDFWSVRSLGHKSWHNKLLFDNDLGKGC